MKKLTNGEINKALSDSSEFEKLEPAQMMHVLVTDLMRSGDVKTKNFDIWLKQEDKWGEITAEERLDQVLRILEMPKAQKSLQAFQKIGFLRFCLGKCFPIKKLMDKKTFYAVIDNFDKIDIRLEDIPFRLAILMFSFDPERTKESLLDANVDAEDAEWIYALAYNFIEFIKLNNEKKLRRFLEKHGTDFYYDMNDYAQTVVKITGMRELKPLESKSFVDAMVRRGEI